MLRPETDDLAPTHLSDEGVGARRGPDDAELDGGTRCLGELRQVDVAQRIERLDLGAVDRQVYGRSEPQQRLPAQFSGHGHLPLWPGAPTVTILAL